MFPIWVPYSPGGPASEFHEEGEEQTLTIFTEVPCVGQILKVTNAMFSTKCPEDLLSTHLRMWSILKNTFKKLSRVYIPKELELYVLVPSIFSGGPKQKNAMFLKKELRSISHSILSQ